MDVRRLGEDVLNLRPVFPKWVRGMELTQGNISKVRREAAGKSEHFEWDEYCPASADVFGMPCTWIVQYKIGKKLLSLRLAPRKCLRRSRPYWLGTENGDKKAARPKS
jgi:hypothetical protein